MKNIFINIYRAVVSDNIRLQIRNIRNLFNYLIILLRGFISSIPISDYKQIPIIINNRNRYTYLIMLLEYLKRNGYNNIIILDNDSTYPPLLDYYKNCEHRIVYLNRNLGHLALNKCGLYNEIRKSYFVYTDPDILPIEDCPEDFLKHFIEIMKKNTFVYKVGFSLKIDDLPVCNKLKENILQWENQFWENMAPDNTYKAKIDTTFALYRPFTKVGFLTKGVFKFGSGHRRTDYPYQARHLPWYEDSGTLSDETLYYIQNAETKTAWTKRAP